LNSKRGAEGSRTGSVSFEKMEDDKEGMGLSPVDEDALDEDERS
jgi:hypothetical protein